jgi:hypothetical protein
MTTMSHYDTEECRDGCGCPGCSGAPEGFYPGPSADDDRMPPLDAIPVSCFVCHESFPLAGVLEVHPESRWHSPLMGVCGFICGGCMSDLDDTVDLNDVPTWDPEFGPY